MNYFSNAYLFFLKAITGFLLNTSMVLTVPTFNYCTKCVVNPGIIHGHGYMDDLTFKRGSYSQAAWVIDVLGLFFDMPCSADCTTRQCEAFGRLVQELNVCTVVHVVVISF